MFITLIHNETNDTYSVTLAEAADIIKITWPTINTWRKTCEWEGWTTFSKYGYTIYWKHKRGKQRRGGNSSGKKFKKGNNLRHNIRII